MVPLLAACTGDDDDDATATPDSPAVATTPDTDTTPDDADTTPDMDVTPDVDTTPDVTGTPDSDGTPDTDMTGTPDTATTPDTTPDTGMTGTPDTGMTGTPDTATTPDTTPDTGMTGTPDTVTTPDTGATDDPFGDLSDLTTDVPNFTLEFMGQFNNVPDDTGELYTSNFEMMLAQSEPDVYHLQLMTTGDEEIQVEVWALQTATYLSEDGSDAIELPAGMAGEFSLAEALVVMPPVELIENAEEIGEDEVNGRTATEYRVGAEEALFILMTQGENVSVTNPEGEMNIWVDEELGIIVQMTADITFENEDGSEGSIDIEYSVYDIDETDDIEAPTGS